jgi:thioesterase domain-containing protein
VLQPVPQPVVLFRATESEEPEQLARDWQQWTRGGVKLVMVPGNHYTMLTRENAATIAGILEDCLKALDAQWALARMVPSQSSR